MTATFQPVYSVSLRRVQHTVGAAPSRKVDSCRSLVLNYMTGLSSAERLLTERLVRNQISGGTELLRITGAGPNASSLQ